MDWLVRGPMSMPQKRRPRLPTPYELENPTISFRLVKEAKSRWDRLREKTGEAYPELIRKAMDVLEGKVLEQVQLSKKALERGRSLGRSEALGHVTVPCKICKGPAEINVNADSSARETLEAAFSDWGHVRCLEETGLGPDELSKVRWYNSAILGSGAIPPEEAHRDGIHPVVEERILETNQIAKRLSGRPLVPILEAANPHVVRLIPRDALSDVAAYNLVIQTMVQGFHLPDSQGRFVPLTQKAVVSLRDSDQALVSQLQEVEQLFEKVRELIRLGQYDGIHARILAIAFLRLKILTSIRRRFFAESMDRTMERLTRGHATEFAALLLGKDGAAGLATKSHPDTLLMGAGRPVGLGGNPSIGTRIACSVVFSRDPGTVLPAEPSGTGPRAAREGAAPPRIRS